MQSKKFKRLAWGAGVAIVLGWLIGLYHLDALTKTLFILGMIGLALYVFGQVLGDLVEVREQVKILYSLFDRLGLVRVKTIPEPYWLNRLFGPWTQLEDTSQETSDFQSVVSPPIVTAYELVLEIFPSQVGKYLGLSQSEQEALVNWQALPNQVRWKRWTGWHESSEILTWHLGTGSKILSTAESFRGNILHRFCSSNSDVQKSNGNCWHAEIEAGESCVAVALWLGSRDKKRGKSISHRVLLSDKALKPFLAPTRPDGLLSWNVDCFDARISDGLPSRFYEHVDQAQGVNWRLTHYPDLRKVLLAKVMEIDRGRVLVKTDFNGRNYGYRWPEKEEGSQESPVVGELVHVVINKEGKVEKLWRTSQMYCSSV